jgi:hypothetical protein
VPSSEEFGLLALASQVSLSVEGVGSGVSVGLPTVASNYVVSPLGFDAGLIGQPTVSPGGVTITLQGFLAGENFGSPSLLPSGVTLQVGAANEGSLIGTPVVLASGITLAMEGLATGEAFGGPAFAFGGVSLQIGSAATGATLGVPQTAALYTLQVTTAGFSEAVGIPALTSVYGVIVSGVESGETFGAGSFSTQVSLSAPSANLQASFGAPDVFTEGDIIALMGISSGVVFGENFNLTAPYVIGPLPILSGEIVPNFIFAFPDLIGTLKVQAYARHMIDIYDVRPTHTIETSVVPVVVINTYVEPLRS